VLDSYYERIVGFWDYFLGCFPEINSFVEGESVTLNGEPFNRNNVNGGSLLLRPVGQILFAKMYFEMNRLNELDMFKEKLRLIDFRLSGLHWKYLFWDGGKIVAKHERLKLDVFRVLLGKSSNTAEVNKHRKELYRLLQREYDGDLSPV
jgi:hypothetical protein